MDQQAQRHRVLPIYPGDIDFDISKEKMDYKQATQQKLKKAKKALATHENSNKRKHIQECVENVRNLRNSDQHSKFFRKADPDRLESNLWESKQESTG